MYITLFGIEINWVSQIFSLIATILMIAGFYVSRKKFMVLLSVSLVFCIIEFVILKRYPVCISYAVSILRNVAQIFYDKKDKRMPFWLTAIFVAAALGVGLPFVKVWFEALPVIGTVCFMLANHLNSWAALKTACAGKQLLSIAHGALARSPVAVIREVIVLIAIIGGIIKSVAEKRKAAKQQNDDALANQDDAAVLNSSAASEAQVVATDTQVAATDTPPQAE